MTLEDHFERQFLDFVPFGVAPLPYDVFSGFRKKPSFTSVTGGPHLIVPPAFGENLLGENILVPCDTEAGGLSRLVKSIEAKVQEQS